MSCCVRLGNHFDRSAGTLLKANRTARTLVEVVLVAILDADQEGFLRSERSLIQTVGRAARHVEGRAILYADRVTGSMQRALDEMDRRRAIQEQHNADFGITPKSIQKSVDEVRFVTRVADARSVSESKPNASEDLGLLDRENLIPVLEKQMQEASAELDYETAAQLRDQIFELKAQGDPDQAEPRSNRNFKPRKRRG